MGPQAVKAERGQDCAPPGPAHPRRCLPARAAVQGLRARARAGSQGPCAPEPATSGPRSRAAAGGRARVEPPGASPAPRREGCLRALAGQPHPLCVVPRPYSPGARAGQPRRALSCPRVVAGQPLQRSRPGSCRSWPGRCLQAEAWGPHPRAGLPVQPPRLRPLGRASGPLSAPAVVPARPSLGRARATGTRAQAPGRVRAARGGGGRPCPW